MSIARRRFRIIKEIAEGGFGKVYLAEQISSDGFSRIVAIKLLHAKWSSHDEVVKRTRDEARVLGRIRHQHIVKVEDLTSIEGKCAIVMEYLEGVDLKWMMTFLKERKLEFSRAALFEIILAVASALDAAYNGVPLQGDQPLRAIHRDIKPSNIFVTVAGGVKVLDFGTARANFAEREAKTQALAFGSQGYMAPERMLGEEDTPAADIFSLGITLYELLTLDSFGRIPPRPNKFQKKVEERVAAVPLKGEEDWVAQVRDTLRLMLSYAPAERPTASQLVEIMDLLAQEANDTGLRRYCRTLVAEAKDALPPLDTGDTLCGTIVDEDDSVPQLMTGNVDSSTTSFAQLAMTPAGPGGGTDQIQRASLTGGNRANNSPSPDRSPGPVSLYPRSPGTGPVGAGTSSLAGTSMPPGTARSPGGAGTASLAGSIPPGASGSKSPGAGRIPAPPGTEFVASPVVSNNVSNNAAPPAPENLRTLDPGGQSYPGQASQDQTVPSWSDMPAPQPVPPKPGVNKVVVAAVAGVLLLLVLGGVFFFAMGGLALVYSWWNRGDDVEVPIPVPGDPMPPGPGPDGDKPVGATITSPDNRADAKRVPTVLKFSDPAGGEVTIVGPGSFRAQWDGRAPFDLGPLGEGQYRATVTAGGQTFRLKSFLVDKTKASCAFTFDLSKGDWAGGCQ